MTQKYMPPFKTWLAALCLSAAIVVPVSAQNYVPLPELSPEQIAMDTAFSYDADTGVSVVNAPSFDPFENDSTLAGKASLRSGGSATTFEGKHVSGGAFLDLSMIYTNGSNDPYDVRGFERYVYVSGQPVDQIFHDTKTLDCSENVREVVYDDGYHRGASAGLLAGLYFAFPRYRGHRHYWESGYYRGYRSAWRDWRRRRPHVDRVRPRHPRDPRHAGHTGRLGERHNDLHDNGRRADHIRPRRDGSRHGHDTRGQGTRGHDDGRQSDVRPGRRDNNTIREERDARLDRGNRRHPPSGRSLVMGTSERIPDVDRRDSNRREVQPVVNKDKNAPRIARSYRRDKHPERSRTTQREKHVIRKAPSAPAPVKAQRHTEIMRSEPVKRSEPRRVSSPPKRKERRTERRRTKRKSNIGRATDRHFKSKSPSRRSHKKMNFFPVQNSGYLSYPRSSRREVHVSYRCVREETSVLHIPQERLEAARFDGLTIVVVDNQDRDIPVYIPPNYIEGFRQAVVKSGGASAYDRSYDATPTPPYTGYPQQ